MTVWKFVTFDSNGESIDIITFNCSTQKKMFGFIKKMGFTKTYTDGFGDKPIHVFENGSTRADLEEYEGYEEFE